eukprot:GEMP01027303.1.p1 GENE.GEMP01027303.1~~GEMP01027303.1.p1  ORF type:complete len:242 (+),score=67.53 GEMP01027303.1:26-751(+)
MALSMVDGDKNRPVADAKGMPNRRECVEHTVICRYLSGEPVALQHCSTVVDMKVRVANIHDCFALDVVVLEDGVVLKDDHVFDEAPAEVQIIMLQDRVYSEDKWVKALLQHTVCGDVASVQKALGRMSEQAQKQQYEQSVNGTKKTHAMIDLASVAGRVVFDHLEMLHAENSDNLRVSIDVLRVLCDAGVDLNEHHGDDVQDGYVWTSLCCAIWQNLLDVAQLLIAYGACAERTLFNAIQA